MAKNSRVNNTLNANGTEIAIVSANNEEDYISLTDIAKYKSDNPNAVIQNWMRNRDTIEFLGLWERLNNSDFKPIEFEGFKSQAGSNSFVLSPQKWIASTNAIGIRSKSGRYGGTYAHKDIAFEFASWVSPEFKLYIIKDYQRLKLDENHRLSLEWNLNRALAKLNYRIHTDAIKEHLIPSMTTSAEKSFAYANEADVLNKVLFGKTASQWKSKNPDKIGNIRDDATIEQLLVLQNIESANAYFMQLGMSKENRFDELRKMAISQIKSLIENNQIKKLTKLNEGR